MRIVLAMMEELGQTLLAKPEHVLQFIEGVLGDEAVSLQAGETRPLVIEEIEDTAANRAPQVKESDIESMSIVETALQLLLASLEGMSDWSIEMGQGLTAQGKLLRGMARICFCRFERTSKSSDQNHPPPHGDWRKRRSPSRPAV
jgi:hypothetical protein